VPPPPPGFPPAEGLDYSPTMGEPVEFEARYVVSPVAGGKDLQAAYLLRDDGESWIRSYRPVAEELRFADKRVVVRGRPYVNSPYVQSVGGTHFELESIALAPGETPWEPEPTRIPSPPWVADQGALAAREHLWAQVVGALESLKEPHPDRPWWGQGTLRLADRTAVLLRAIPWEEGAPAVVGAEVTALGRVVAPEEPGAPWSLEGPLRLCAGRVERCLVDDAWQEERPSR